MNQEDIIRIAREAGFADGAVDIIGLDGFANFANLVAAAEREACAKVCEAIATETYGMTSLREYGECAAAIRARGQA
jgi:hypothetical protein